MQTTDIDVFKTLKWCEIYLVKNPRCIFYPRVVDKHNKQTKFYSMLLYIDMLWFVSKNTINTCFLGYKHVLTNIIKNKNHPSFLKTKAFKYVENAYFLNTLHHKLQAIMKETPKRCSLSLFFIWGTNICNLRSNISLYFQTFHNRNRFWNLGFYTEQLYRIYTTKPYTKM